MLRLGSGTSRRQSLLAAFRVPGREKEPSPSPRSTILTFYSWLVSQTSRGDAVGLFARYAVRDLLFPRDARKLVIFLMRYEGMPEQRDGVKLAHREWRQTRQAAE